MRDYKRYMQIQSEYDTKNGITLRVLAKRYGITYQRVQQIVSFDLRKDFIKQLIKLIKIIITHKKRGETIESIRLLKRKKEKMVGDFREIVNNLPHNRKKETVEIKKDIAWKLYLDGFSLSAIGRFFGHKDHTTARFWIKNMKNIKKL